MSAAAEADAVFLTTEDLANRWKISPATLRTWRTKGAGPRFVKLGGQVRYLLADVLAYEGKEQPA